MIASAGDARAHVVFRNARETVQRNAPTRAVGVVRLRVLVPAGQDAGMLRTLVLLALLAIADDGRAATAADLRSAYASLKPALAASAFGRPLTLVSREEGGQVTGEIHALVNHPFGLVRHALATASDWCGVLYLHLNVKSCAAGTEAGSPVLRVALGRKADSAEGRTFELVFNFQRVQDTGQFFQVVMTADEGPLGSSGYRLALDAIPVAGNQAFLRLVYSVTYGAAARGAMSAYLHTLGRSKVGFTVTGRRPDGTAIYGGGIRGALERNTLRYYLAIDTWLAAAARSPPRDERWRLESWYAATEHYALQLHELPREQYLRLKSNPAPAQR